MVEAKSTIGLCKNTSIELSALLKLVGFGEMMFLGDTTSPWLLKEHYYKPVKEALAYLGEHKLSKSFNGALCVDEVDLPEFLKHVFWLVRCNGVVFMPHFTNKDFSAMIYICQYGNIHFSTLNKVTDDLFNEVIANTKLIFFDGKKCASYKVPHRVATRT
ncbi:hypothetical protein [Mucilaginibacter sp. FT3.2]|uniref:hypothetical protein n=1 Tax=Mucilaginibacter sp. FT3.2 TaxID=2723090 RepID=UPI003AFF7643